MTTKQENGAITGWDEAVALQRNTSDPVVTAFVGYALGHLANYYANRGKPRTDFDAAFFAAVAAEMAGNKTFLTKIVNGEVNVDT